MALPIVKLIGLAAKQIAKPVSSALVGRAKKAPDGLVRSSCLAVGQTMNYARVLILRRSDGRSQNERQVVRTTSYYADPAENEIAGDGDGAGASPVTQLERAGRIERSSFVEIMRIGGPMKGLDKGPMLFVEWRSKSSLEKKQAWIKKYSDDGKETLRTISVKPLPEQEALEEGSVIVAETMIFSVAAGVALWEYCRSVKSSEHAAVEKKRRHDEKEAKRMADSALRDVRLEGLEQSTRQFHEDAQKMQRLEHSLQLIQADVQRTQRIAAVAAATSAAVGAMLAVTFLGRA